MRDNKESLLLLDNLFYPLKEFSETLTDLTEAEQKKAVDEILLDYLVNDSSDALIETVIDNYPDVVRERLR